MKKILLLLIILIPFSGWSQRKKVLVFHSYHQGLQWTDNVNKGVHRVFAPVKDSVEIFYEYLDRKRNLSQPYYEGLESLYKIKLQQESFDVVLISDNDALAFALRNRKQYFGDTPLVFCGINNFSEDIIEGQSNITGIIEKPDFGATLDLMRQLHPKKDKLYIINDDKTTTAIENKKSLRQIEPTYKEDLQFVYWEDLRKEDFHDSIRRLDHNSILLLLTFNKDKEGKFLSYRENGELVPQETQTPVYTTWKFFMSGNVIGGKMISGEEQGYRAGKQAIAILRGKAADSIPVVMESLSKYIFDYNMLKKYGIKENQLPDKAQFLHKPESFYTINKRLINIGLVSLAAAVIIILMLSNAIIRRRKAEKSLIQKQQHLQGRYRFQKLMSDVVVLLNSTNDFTRVTDPILQRITDHYRIGKVSLYNFNEDEAIGRVIGSNVSNLGRGITELKQQDYNKLARIIEVLKDEDYFISSDLSGLTPDERAFYKKREIQAIAIFPIKIGDKLFGMAGFAQPDVYHWKASEIEEIATIVKLIANAWERNAQMNKHLEAQKKHVAAVRLVEKSSRLASIGVMASGITHEINQPLNALRISIDSIRYWERKNSGQVPEMVKSKLDTLSSGVSRIDGIIKHMRDFWVAPSQMEQSGEVGLVKAVKNAFSLLERQMSDHRITPELRFPDKEIKVKASFIQLEQIIINLVVNAIQALDKKEGTDKKIIIEARETARCASIIVADNGTGIPDGVTEKLYDPFYSAGKDNKGTGLGLAIVKTFVDKLHGEIVHENNVYGGATFTVTICKTDKEIKQ